MRRRQRRRWTAAAGRSLLRTRSRRWSARHPAAGRAPAAGSARIDTGGAGETAAAAPGDAEAPAVESPGRLENIVESLLFASDKPLGVGELKRLVSERDSKKITAAV